MKLSYDDALDMLTNPDAWSADADDLREAFAIVQAADAADYDERHIDVVGVTCTCNRCAREHQS